MLFVLKDLSIKYVVKIFHCSLVSSTVYLAVFVQYDFLME